MRAVNLSKTGCVAASSEGTTTSAAASSFLTSARESKVLLVRTATGILVIFFISLISQPIDLLRVGSPEPER